MDELEMPTMDWEGLENRIAQLQLREMEKEASHGSRGWRTPAYLTSSSKTEGESTRLHVQTDDVYDDGEMTRKITALTSRRQNRMNLQLCFINDSSSDQESDGEDTVQSLEAEKRDQISADPSLEPSHPSPSKSFSDKRKELKMEAQKLLAETKKQMEHTERLAKEKGGAALSGDTTASKGVNRSLELSDLQKMTMKQMESLKDDITVAIQNLNTELMQLLLTRDELQMEQDAILLEMEDWATLAESQHKHSWKKETK